MSEITPSPKNRPRGYIVDYRPSKSTRVLLDQVQAVLEEYRDYRPLTCRQIFYRLVGAHGFDKTEGAYKKLCHHMANARRGRVIAFSSIRDDGVSGWGGGGYEDKDAFLRSMRESARYYSRDKMRSQELHVEVWCEAAGMLDQLARVTSEFDVSCYSSGGFDSVTAKKDVAERIVRRDKPAVVLHLGDFDPSGESIFDSFARDVAAFVEADRPHGFVTVQFKRVALTREQVRAYDLPTAPPKATDTRAKGWDGGTCQLEALPPDVIAGILREAILQHIDLEQFERDRETEKVERAELTRLLLTDHTREAPR